MIKLVNMYDDEWVFDEELIDHSSFDEFDLAIDIWHSGEFSLAEEKFKAIISKNLYHIDAYHHLSILYEDVSMDFEAYLCCREAARIGLSVMPKKFSWQSSKLVWGHLENRPFLRAYHNLGLWLEKRKEIDESINVFTNILSVCPGDNLGVRYKLPQLWLEKGDVLSVIRHCKTFSDDYSPEIMYTYPLALVLSGEAEKARPLLAEAKAQFPLVAKELNKKRHPKPKSGFYGGVTVGGADQAYEYWEQYGKYWSGSKQARELLSGI